ncbi:MAG TPA: DNA mismatch repair protein MutS [Ktedonobacterales bacterium]|nr:DNA mismatch repair protein MutS [Ktedonobacterales bacterium]
MASPARRQYLDIKAQHQDALLAYNIGDFYEFFDEDARTVARELQIVLTARSYGPGEAVPLAGVPTHALETYLARLVARGYKVAVCDQVSPPGRGLVKREVTRILTPGTVVEPNMVPVRRDNYLVALAFGARGGAGLAVVEASTGAFSCVEWEPSRLPAALRAELERLAPAEVLLAERVHAHPENLIDEGEWLAHWTLTPCSDTWFEEDGARRRMCRHFSATTLVAYGCEHLPLATSAAGAILAYLERMNPTLLPLLTNLKTYDTAGFVEIDGRTWRALEVIEPAHVMHARTGRETPTTLLATLDATRTAMGARLLRRSLLQPLRDRAALEERLDAVAELHAATAMRQQLASTLDGLGDLERLIARIVHGSAVPREAFGLESALARVPKVAAALSNTRADALTRLREDLDACPRARELIVRALAEPGAGTGRLIRAGYNDELDALAQSAAEARQWIAMLEADERERTGIKSLKVGFNKVFGYYIEVTTPNLSRVPEDYQRRQTISTGERYVTPELKAHEAQVLHASEQIEVMERTLYVEVLRSLAGSATPMRRTATALAQVDMWLALAEVALARNYVRPELADDARLEIVAGRHPVVESAPEGGEFIANDTRLRAHNSETGDSGETERHGAPTIMLLTGPNMAGKSTYLRQVALITLLAQIGSFVPAEAARIGLVDRIFTRVGAEDDLARGLSTFMLEMVETAYILRHATARSLVILDEVGRGTSTADGLSIARAVVEYLHDRVGARTLFATHYHELADLAETLPQVGVFRMAVAERADSAIFLHRVVEGASADSYGVQVARMAGLPSAVTERASALLQQHASVQRRVAEMPAPYVTVPDDTDGSGPEIMRREERELALDLAAANIAAMTPIEAINALFALQQRALALLRAAGEGV